MAKKNIIRKIAKGVAVTALTSFLSLYNPVGTEAKNLTSHSASSAVQQSYSASPFSQAAYSRLTSSERTKDDRTRNSEVSSLTKYIADNFNGRSTSGIYFGGGGMRYLKEAVTEAYSPDFAKLVKEYPSIDDIEICSRKNAGAQHPAGYYGNFDTEDTERDDFIEKTSKGLVKIGRDNLYAQYDAGLRHDADQLQKIAEVLRVSEVAYKIKDGKFAKEFESLMKAGRVDKAREFVRDNLGMAPSYFSLDGISYQSSMDQVNKADKGLEQIVDDNYKGRIIENVPAVAGSIGGNRKHEVDYHRMLDMAEKDLPDFVYVLSNQMDEGAKEFTGMAVSATPFVGLMSSDGKNIRDVKFVDEGEVLSGVSGIHRVENNVEGNDSYVVRRMARADVIGALRQQDSTRLELELKAGPAWAYDDGRVGLMWVAPDRSLIDLGSLNKLGGGADSDSSGDGPGGGAGDSGSGGK